STTSRANTALKQPSSWLNCAHATTPNANSRGSAIRRRRSGWRRTKRWESSKNVFGGHDPPSILRKGFRPVSHELCLQSFRKWLTSRHSNEHGLQYAVGRGRGNRDYRGSTLRPGTGATPAL